MNSVKSSESSIPPLNGELVSFAENIWIVDGPVVRDMGILFTTRMASIKLSDGAIWINSPVPAQFETLKSIAELGPVTFLLAGTPRHVWRLEGWHTLFPEAQLWATRHTIMPFKKLVYHLLVFKVISLTERGLMTSIN